MSNHKASIAFPENPINTGNFVAKEGVSYYVDTSGGAITFTIEDGADFFSIIDYAATFTATNYLDMVCGVDTVRFALAQQSQPFKVIKSGNEYRSYGKDGFVNSGNIT